MKRKIQQRIDLASQAPSKRSAWLGIFLFIVLMITREGMETALLLGSLFFQMRAPRIFAGALMGILAAAAVAALWSRYGHKVDLRRFLQVTAVFLLVFVAQLLIYGVHELAEANAFPHSAAVHEATEPYGPDGIFGHWLSLGLVVVPLAWLLISYWTDRISGGTHPGVEGIAAS